MYLKKYLVQIAMLTALTVCLSLMFIFPVPATNGFVTLCEVGIYMTALMFGPVGGFWVGALSGGLIDLFSGYPQWMLFSFVIHGVQGAIAGYFFYKPWKSGLVLGLSLASVFMIVGYTLATALLYTWPAGLASILGNTVQNLFGVATTLLLMTALKKNECLLDERRNNPMEKELLIRDLTTMTEEILAQAQLKAGDIFVLGCSTSEIMGRHIGKNPSQEVGEWIIQTLLKILTPQEIFLAVQGCEHLNRALVVEQALAEKKSLEIVTVRPSLHAGGACSVAAFNYFTDPVEVEAIVAQAGIDIGDTSIGMHIKHVQVPVRPSVNTLGHAHVTALRSRPKFIGGPRAVYS